MHTYDSTCSVLSVMIYQSITLLYIVISENAFLYKKLNDITCLKKRETLIIKETPIGNLFRCITRKEDTLLPFAS